MKVNPKMVSSSVQLKYRADDGFSSTAAYSSKRSGSAESCLTLVADEIGRLAELFGFGDDVEAAIKDARQRVREWRTAQGEGK
jgi:hypothetical protein